ncbi:710_t:CDS:2, partial [Gigaspora margarita]
MHQMQFKKSKAKFAMIIKNSSNSSKLEFVPYEQIINIKYITKGGFSTIYKATWIDGPIVHWTSKNKDIIEK